MPATPTLVLVDNGDGTFSVTAEDLGDGTYSATSVLTDPDRIGVQLGSQLLTGTDGNGAVWSVAPPITGWGGSPSSSLSLTQKLRSPGGWLSPRQLTPRVIGLSGGVYCPSGPDGLRLAEDALNFAAGLDATTLTVIEGAVSRAATVYRQDVVLFEWVTDRLANWSVQMVAADPRKYAAAMGATTGLPASSGGITFPLSFPFSFASTVVSGQCSLTNPGNTTGPVTLRIDGPVTGPAVTHVSTGLQLVFASSLTLNTGEYLLVDMEAQTALANGQSSRAGWITNRGWSGFDPGPNTWAFAATSGSGLLTVTATPAWL